MDMSDEWLRGLRAWASANANVRELWLFGSRADGHAKPESDVDLAIALMPDALGNYYALGDGWQREKGYLQTCLWVACYARCQPGS